MPGTASGGCYLSIPSSFLIISGDLPNIVRERTDGKYNLVMVSYNS